MKKSNILIFLNNAHLDNPYSIKEVEDSQNADEGSEWHWKKAGDLISEILDSLENKVLEVHNE